MLDAWIRIGADGKVTVFTGKVELGQGIVTALAQIAAEELDVPLAQVTMVPADTGRTPNEGQTAGSQSVENSGTALRMAGAEVRAILLELAAKRFGVGADTLKVADGVITAPDGRKVSYGELAGEANLKREATAQAKAKPAAQHKIVGKTVERLDIPAKMTGGAAFVQDLRLPGMLHGRVARPPRYGSKLDSFDEAKIKAMPGVVAVVRDGSFLGVVAQREEQAIKAVVALAASAKWTGGPELPDPARLYQQLMTLKTEDKVISAKDAPLPAGAKVVEATYHRPYQAHAAIAPSCAVAQVQDGKLTAWTHSQGVYPLRGTLARALKMQGGNIRCIHMEGAGCYGHNGADDVALDAALLARATNGRPVRVQWMRADEFMWEPYGPGHDHAGESSARQWPHRRLELRRLEPEPQHAAGRSGWRQPACELVHGRAASARPGAPGAAAERGGRSQRHSALRSAAPQDHASPDHGQSGAHLGAAHARRLWQCVRDRVLHG